jgi:hypothetical protein
LIVHPAWFVRTIRGLAFVAASAGFMVLGCEHGCHLRASKGGLHQTHLRGRPKRPARRLDCGKDWSQCVTSSWSRPRNSAVPRRRPVRGFKMTGSSLTADVSPCGSGRGSPRRPSYGAARRAGSGRAILRFVVSSQIRATVRGPTTRKGVGHGDAGRVAGSTVTAGCHAPAQSVSALSTRLVRVRPLVPQLDA